MEGPSVCGQLPQRVSKRNRSPPLLSVKICYCLSHDATHPLSSNYFDTFLLTVERCDDKWRKKLEGAWKEAQQLQQAQTVFNIGYNYDIPHTQWLGKDWNSESSWIP